MTNALRVVLAVRLSRDREETTSIDSQLKELRDYAARHGHVIVGEAIDVDESGGKPIRRRPQIGAWLKAERLPEWDAILGYSTDRLFRNLYDFITFYQDFLLPNGKHLILATENLDMSTSDGRSMASMRVVWAQNELDKISERNARKARTLLAQGYWRGGPIPFGYTPQKSGLHTVLVPHPEHAPLIRWLASEILKGKSVGWAAEQLTSRGIPTGRKHKGTPRTKWHPGPLRRALLCPTIAGYIVCELKAARGGQRETYKLARRDDGSAMMREGVLDERTWRKLRTVLDTEYTGPRKRHSATLLAGGIAFCGGCGSALWHNQWTSRGATYSYYNCAARCEAARSLNVARVNEAVTDAIMAYADSPHAERELVRGDNHDEEIAEVEAQIHELDLDAPNAETRFKALRAERARLKVLPSEPDKWERRPSGKTVGQAWQELDDEGRRLYLVEQGVTVSVSARGKGYGRELIVSLGGVPDEWHEGGELYAGMAALGATDTDQWPPVADMLAARGLPTDTAEVERLVRETATAS